VRYLYAPLRELPPAPEPGGGEILARWTAAVRGASEPCVLLDLAATVTAASPAFAEMVGMSVHQLAGASLFGTVLQVLDFNGGLPVPAGEVSRVPPLVALSAGALARSLLRVRRRDGTSLTLDAVSSPLRGGPENAVQGSMTFMHVV